jgi:pSer/pThr/pTyr-binding forkhead associated (FHA) protein
MAKLILSMDGQVLKEITLSKERTTIGRKPHNDIQIDNLAVSGEHAVIVSILNDCFLEDLGSTNGTQVNGQSVKKHFLQNNDVIELGKYKFKYVQEVTQPPAAAPAVEKADFEKTMVLRPSAMRAVAEQAKAMAAGGQAGAADAVRAAAVKQAAASAAAAGVADKDAKAAPVAALTAAPAAAAASTAAPTPIAPKPAPASAPPAPAAPAPKPLRAAIQLLSGANAGKELELSKPLTTLGRPGVQVAVLTRRPQGYFITHVEGAQQPAVNGQAIGTAPHPLKDHDLIEIAGIKLEFFLKG